ncbi:lysine N(6)-hydroxylase/L-ornithine N(5)-oxygenase family protein [Pistricoccus aurantiacus]|uniref:lysine N(6)-hydroxylase/L-ornithine N(5)-oxygenase family protein n=1 Tax=Pistricoccus aurantiacus TaxID=1883414 RepID=UPI003633C077
MTAPLDLAGIGIGPFNLSIAALLDSPPHNRQPRLQARFFDRKPRFDWHPGMLLPGVRLQTSFLKDLVTGVAPQSPYSFLQFLVSQRRFYQFLAAELPAISRVEYGQYLSWAAEQLASLHFDSQLETLDFDGDHFRLHFSDDRQPVMARHLCLGTGKPPWVPDCCRPHLGSDCFHAIGIANRALDLRGKRVAIVGGGQSGAEVLQAILDEHWGRPAQVNWLSRRSNFAPLDETPFTNEYFTPQYIAAFFDLPGAVKQRVVEEQKLASDGISPATLKAIYRRLYEGQVRGDLFRVRLMPGRELQGMARQGDTYRLAYRNRLDATQQQCEAEVVILATGFSQQLPAYLAPLRECLELDDSGQLILDQHFQVQWKNMATNRIYAVNAGRFSHGIAEPQMSLMCWRSATIINHLAGEEIFDTGQGTGMVDWRG